MVPKQILPALLAALLGIFAAACGNDPKPAKTTVATPPASAPAPRTPATQAPADNPKAATGQTAAMPTKPGLNPERIAVHPSEVKMSTAGQKPSPVVDAGRSKNARPMGYITRGNVILYSEASQNSAKIATLKDHETVYILETRMTDDEGRASNVPTWYKIEREDKRSGWVVGSAVSAGGGG